MIGEVIDDDAEYVGGADVLYASVNDHVHVSAARAWRGCEAMARCCGNMSCPTRGARANNVNANNKYLPARSSSRKLGANNNRHNVIPEGKTRAPSKRCCHAR